MTDHHVIESVDIITIPMIATAITVLVVESSIITSVITIIVIIITTSIIIMVIIIIIIIIIFYSTVIISELFLSLTLDKPKTLSLALIGHSDVLLESSL